MKIRNVLIGTGIGVVLGGILGWSISPLISFLPTLSVIGIGATVVGIIGLVIGAKYL